MPLGPCLPVSRLSSAAADVPKAIRAGFLATDNALKSMVWEKIRNGGFDDQDIVSFPPHLFSRVFFSASSGSFFAVLSLSGEWSLERSGREGRASLSPTSLSF